MRNLLALLALLSASTMLYGFQDSLQSIHTIKLVSPIQLSIESPGSPKPFWREFQTYSLLLTFIGIALSFFGLQRQIKKSTTNLREQIYAQYRRETVNELRSRANGLIDAVEKAAALPNSQVESGRMSVNFAQKRLLLLVPRSSPGRSSLEEALNKLNDNLHASTDKMIGALEEVLTIAGELADKEMASFSPQKNQPHG